MLKEIATAIADAIREVGPELTNVDELQVEPSFVINPTGPCVDVYPGDPFEEGLGFGDDRKLFWTVRARIGTSDQDASQDVLLELMEPTGATSVEDALLADPTLGGVVDSVGVEGPTAYTLFVDASGQGAMLGVSWRVSTLTRESLPS